MSTSFKDRQQEWAIMKKSTGHGGRGQANNEVNKKKKSLKQRDGNKGLHCGWVDSVKEDNNDNESKTMDEFGMIIAL